MPTRHPLRAAATVAVSGLLLVACDDQGDDDEAVVAEDGVVQIVGTDELGFDPATAIVEAGEVTIELTNEPAMPHDVVIEELDNTQVAVAGPGETATGTVELEPGEYTFYCSVGGHRGAGMEGTLVVE